MVKYAMPPRWLIGLMIVESKELEKAKSIAKKFSVPLYGFHGKVLWPA